MSTRKFVAYAVTTVLVLSVTSFASAQYPRYRPPAGNPLPNALNYFRRDVGILDPYNAFVEPRRELDNRMREMAVRQQADYQATRRAIGMIRESEAAPTGSGATFMNYSHYYSRPNSARGTGR